MYYWFVHERRSPGEEATFVVLFTINMRIRLATFYERNGEGAKEFLGQLIDLGML